MIWHLNLNLQSWQTWLQHARLLAVIEQRYHGHILHGASSVQYVVPSLIRSKRFRACFDTLRMKKSSSSSVTSAETLDVDGTDVGDDDTVALVAVVAAAALIYICILEMCRMLQGVITYPSDIANPDYGVCRMYARTVLLGS